jgi:hypothetical protein
VDDNAAGREFSNAGKGGGGMRKEEIALRRTSTIPNAGGRR